MAVADGPLFRAPVGIQSGSATCCVTCVFVDVLRFEFLKLEECGGGGGVW